MDNKDHAAGIQTIVYYMVTQSKQFRKIIKKAKKKLYDFYFQYQDLLNDTREIKHRPSIISYNNIYAIETEKIDHLVATYLAERYLEHRFDLLGSGWVKNGYESKAMGLEGYRYDMNLHIDNFDKNGDWLRMVVRTPYIKCSRSFWNLIDDNYEPIDWQKDFKSGYRWNAKEWYKRQKCGVKPGADIKLPWELARMQHLPQMAIFAMILPDKKEILINEFKNQVLDFIATNPPRMGVNWVCTMDVAIRAANMLLAFDLLRQIDSNKTIKADFIGIFEQSIYQHGLHIVNNLEYWSELTSNHYLSDICGLVFIALYLECSPEIDCWLAFSVQELISEMKKQFYEDGGNFEASTSYHRLSGEMMVYATAAILGISETKRNSLRGYNAKLWKTKEPKLKSPEEQLFNPDSKELLPSWYMERLFKAGLFTSHITKPSGEIPQIGDNDSGRFFRLSPNGRFLSNSEAEKKYLNLKNYSAHLESSLGNNQYNDNLFWDENILDHATIISAMSGLFEDKEFDKCKKKFPSEHYIVRSLARGFPVKAYESTIQCGAVKNDIKVNEFSYHHQEVFMSETGNDGSLKTNLSFSRFPDMGIYIYKSDRLYLCLYAGPNGQHGIGGHAHNDKLSMELCIDGREILKDPGTYMYTPSPDRRNQFRCVKAHATLIVDGFEQNDFDQGTKGLFRMRCETRCRLVEIGDTFLIAQLEYKNICQRRRIEIQDNAVIVDDFSNVPSQSNFTFPREYSNGYGKLCHSTHY